MTALAALLLMSGTALHAANAGGGEETAATIPASPVRDVRADYDFALRRPDGRVDVDGMVARLKELGVTSYYWLIYRQPTDWEDLKSFLPEAAKAGIAVTVYLVPPTACPPHKSNYSEPFRLDYQRWAEEIARLSLSNPNLTSWVIDDFYRNRALFTPVYVGAMQARAKQINPRLVFLPLMYFGEITARFVVDYRDVIDGVVVAYPRDRDAIDRAWAILNDATVPPLSAFSYPPRTRSRRGDFVVAGQTAQVLPADDYKIHFREQDSYTGPTAGYHFKQLLVNDAVAWEADVAGGSSATQDVTVDVTKEVLGRQSVTVAFRLLDKQGVHNFGVRWQLRDLRTQGLRLTADFVKPEAWTLQQRGAFETDFGRTPEEGRRRFHIPFIVMTAAKADAFRKRHGDPATPERIAEWLNMALEACHVGKCDGVVTYCLDKRPASQTFSSARELFHKFGHSSQSLPHPEALRLRTLNAGGR